MKAYHLEGAGYAGSHNTLRILAAEIDTVKNDLPRGRIQKTGKYIEQRSLSRTVGSDHAIQHPRFNREIDIVNSNESVKRFSKTCYLEQDFSPVYGLFAD